MFVNLTEREPWCPVARETGRKPLFDGLPDVDLELVGPDVLDGRLVALEYRPDGLSRGAGEFARKRTGPAI